jgi:hypothetical protein
MKKSSIPSIFLYAVYPLVAVTWLSRMAGATVITRMTYAEESVYERRELFGAVKAMRDFAMREKMVC